MDIFIFFLDRICIVKTQIALAAKFLCHAKIEANGLGMPKMQVTVGLWRKTGCTLPPETAGFVIFLNARPDGNPYPGPCRYRWPLSIPRKN